MVALWHHCRASHTCLFFDPSDIIFTVTAGVVHIAAAFAQFWQPSQLQLPNGHKALFVVLSNLKVFWGG